MRSIYLAGPLFGLAEREFNRTLAMEIHRRNGDLNVILPQDRADKFLHLPGGMKLVFDDCLEMVRKCDFVVALLDGPDSDSGTCVELGYAFAQHKPIVGVRTDFRGSEDRGLNLMVAHLCDKLILENPGSTEELAAKVVAAIGELTVSSTPAGKPATSVRHA